MQTNVPQYGILRRTAADNLTDKEGYLAYLDSNGQLALATAALARAGEPLYVITEGAAATEEAAAQPIVDGIPVRIQADAAGITNGASVQIGATGTVITATTGDVVGHAMETGTSGAQVLIMPIRSLAAQTTKINAIIDYLEDGVLAIGTLAISATAEKFKTTTTAIFNIAGAAYAKAATDNLTFSAGHVVSASKFGVILIQVTAAGTVSTKVPAATQAYDTAPLALAALPSADSGSVAIGYIAIAADSGGWTANTDDMTNGSDLTTATFTDIAARTVPTNL